MEILFFFLLFIPFLSVHGENKCNCTYVTHSSELYITCEANNTSEYKECFKGHRDAKVLHFENSSLTYIPKDIGILQELTYLDVSFNNIKNIDLSISVDTCARTEQLYMDDNEIRTIKSGSLDCFGNLSVISLRKNRIHAIENGSFNMNLKQLVHIDLSYNSLTEIDTSLFYLSKLLSGSKVIVHVHWNQVSSMTNSINMTIADINPKMSFMLSLLHNNVTTIDYKYYFNLLNFTNPAQIYRFWNCGMDIRFNPFICDCALYAVAKLLQEIRHMDPNNPVFSITCYNPPALRGVLVYAVPDKDFNCSVTRQCPESCTCQHTVALNLTSVTCEEQYSGKDLPLSLPRSTNIQLAIHSNQLMFVSDKHYTSNITVLDLSLSSISAINYDIVPKFDFMETLYLHENALQMLPRSITYLNFTKLQTLTIHGNPFKCDCNNLWLKKWIVSQNVTDHIPHQDKILCGSGLPRGEVLVNVPDSQFKCVVTVSRTEIIVISLCAILVFIIFSIILFLGRHRIYIFFLSKTRRKICRDSKYDLYISYNSEDTTAVTEIVQRLERQNPSYRICLDMRDFQVGTLIMDNIVQSIQSSSTIVAVLSNHFLKSEWCLLELQEADKAYHKDKQKGVIFIFLENLQPELLSTSLTKMIAEHRSLRFNDNLFWKKLFVFLPVAESIVSENTPLLKN